MMNQEATCKNRRNSKQLHEARNTIGSIINIKDLLKIENPVNNKVSLQNDLEKIGGHQIYHLEGSAWVHTLRVIDEIKKAYNTTDDSHPMVMAATYHDVGKAMTSVQNGPNDWSYPNHAPEGALRLGEYLSEEDPNFKMVQWFVKYHMKPLFVFERKELEKIMGTVPDDEVAKEYCTLENLLTLSICDLMGSEHCPEVHDEQMAILHHLERLRAGREI